MATGCGHQAGAAQRPDQLLDVGMRQLVGPGNAGQRDGAWRSPSACARATSTRIPYSARVESLHDRSTTISSPSTRTGKALTGTTGEGEDAPREEVKPAAVARALDRIALRARHHPGAPPSWVQTSSMAPQRPSMVCPTQTDRPSTMIRHDGARCDIAGSQASGEPVVMPRPPRWCRCGRRATRGREP